VAEPGHAYVDDPLVDRAKPLVVQAEAGHDRRAEVLDDDITLWWKLAGRNKRTVVADLKDPADLDRVRRLT
jgi:crotonobetainyl-CoA:carnitine CoA-transferase CaiB-like acyl-CoA transferase